MEFTKQLALSISLAVTIFASGSPALAEPDAPKSVTVRYGDLDLARAEGASALYARIRAAAREVCAAAKQPGAARHAEWNACRRHAIDRAVASLGHASITQLHAARTRSSNPAS
jgi:UrcA family protein